jgi:hypothetical protein
MDCCIATDMKDVRSLLLQSCPVLNTQYVPFHEKTISPLRSTDLKKKSLKNYRKIPSLK